MEAGQRGNRIDRKRKTKEKTKQNQKEKTKKDWDDEEGRKD